VFIGSVVAREDPNTGDVQSSADPISWTFDVQSVQKGGAGGSETITSVRDSATCGFEFTVGKRYQVFADRSSSGLTTDICAGTVGLAAGEPGFHVQAGRLSKTGPAPGMALPLLGAFMAVCGAVLARTARKRAYFTWPR
jgi:hypothetical protein